MNTDFDIAICGAGPVGMALAALLVKRGVAEQRIALIDAKTIDQARRDPRSIALSFGSRQILEAIGAWPAALNPIHQIHVSRRRHFGRTLIDCADYGLPALGYVARYGELVSSLSSVIDRARPAVLRPAQIVSSLEQASHVELLFADGSRHTADIMVQAEGGVFGEQADRSLNREYGQTAIIAQVTVSVPLLQRAYERFTDEGPLALLPQDGGYALVWCVKPANAERLLAMGDQAFLSELQHAFGNRLGHFTSATPCLSYPLGLNAHPVSSLRTVAIGNAAQTLHPVAGQGLNLGLRDAAVLARLLAKESSPAALEHFALQRKADRNLTINLTDAMARIFSSTPDGALSQSLLGMSLGLIDIFPFAKQLLAEQMMFGQR